MTKIWKGSEPLRLLIAMPIFEMATKIHTVVSMVAADVAGQTSAKMNAAHKCGTLAMLLCCVRADTILV